MGDASACARGSGEKEGITVQWGKAKNVLIAVLLLVNLFLYAVTAGMVRQRSHMDEEYVENAISLLQSRGVAVERSVFPERRIGLSTLNVSTKEMLYPMARALLEDPSLEPSVAGEGIWFRNEKGSVLLTGSSDFVFVPVKTLNSLEEARELLIKSGFSENELQIEGDRLCQLYKGVLLEGCVTRLQGNALHGRLLDTSRGSSSTQELMDAANALLLFAAHMQEEEKVPCTVSLIGNVYEVETGGLFNAATCTPAYRIVCEAGSYRVDAVSGAVSQQEEDS